MADYTDHKSNMDPFLYNVRYTDHESDMPSFCIMSDTLGLVICVSEILQNGRHVGTHDLCIWHCNRMMPCWTRDLCIWHYTEWRHVGLVICVSDIIQKRIHVGLVICVICHYTKMKNMLGLVICVSDHYTEKDPCWDLWSVYLPLYKIKNMSDSWSV